MPYSYKRPAGMTLIETLFSAIIIGLVVSGVLIIFAHTIGISKRVNCEYTATNLAMSRLERARRVMATNGFDFLVDLQETDTIIDSDGIPDTEGDFQRSTSVTANYNANPRLTRIEAAVVYKYRNAWKTNAIITIDALFTNVED